MIKMIFAGVWICAVTIGSVLYAFSSAKDNPAQPGEPSVSYFGGLDYIKSDVISVPVLSGGAVQGYFLARLVFTAEQKKLAAIRVPAENLLIDQVFGYLYGNPMIDFTRVDRLDIEAFRTGLRDSVNARVGEKLIYEVLVEQVDYLSKQEIRDNQAKRRAGVRVPPLPGAEPRP